MAYGIYSMRLTKYEHYFPESATQLRFLRSSQHSFFKPCPHCNKSLVKRQITLIDYASNPRLSIEQDSHSSNCCSFHNHCTHFHRLSLSVTVSFLESCMHVLSCALPAFLSCSLIFEGVPLNRLVPPYITILQLKAYRLP